MRSSQDLGEGRASSTDVISFLAWALATLAITGWLPASEAETASAMRPDSALTDAEFIAMVGVMDEVGRRAAQAAIEHSQRAEVRDLAQALLRSHTRSTEQIINAASIAGLAPPIGVSSAGARDTLSLIEGTAPERFDLVWVRDRTAAYVRARAIMMRCMDECTVESVRAAADAVLRTIEEDLRNCYAVGHSLEQEEGDRIQEDIDVPAR